MRLLFAALTIVGVACGSSSNTAEPAAQPGANGAATATTVPSASTGSVPSTVLPSTTAGSEPEPIDVDLAPCSDSGDFGLLCEAYSILAREFVDELDDSALADGAARGIREFIADAPGGDGADGFVCQTPTDDFEVTCSVAAAALATADLSTVAEAAVRGMLEFGLDDPNTVYLPPDALARIAEESSGEITGIGALVSTEEAGPDGESTQCFIISQACRMSIVGLIPGAPAELGGLQMGDITVTVDGDSVLGWTADEVVAKVRGPTGTEVVLGVERDGERLEFKVIRAPIVIPVTESEVLDTGIGYISLSQFTSNSDELFHRELESLLDAGVSKLIVDLRNNPGGALTASVRIASEFLGDGQVLRTEAPDASRSYDVRDGGLATGDDVSVVVLVNGASASASEVVSAALQEAGRATIMGEATFGKNTVQQQFNLPDGGAIKVTIARWVTPSGASFGGDGIQPDIIVDVSPDDATDVMLERALSFFEA